MSILHMIINIILDNFLVFTGNIVMNLFNICLMRSLIVLITVFIRTSQCNNMQLIKTNIIHLNSQCDNHIINRLMNLFIEPLSTVFYINSIFFWNLRESYSVLPPEVTVLIMDIFVNKCTHAVRKRRT